MSEETQQAPGEVQDQPTPEPTTEAPVQEESSPEYFSDQFDPSSLPDELQSRYREMQADYTRKTQALAEQRREAEQAVQWLDAFHNDPEFQRQALAELGYEVPDDEEPEPELEEPQFYDPRVDELIAEREQERTRQELDALEQSIWESIDQVGKRDGRTFTDEEKNLLFDAVLAMPPDEQGGPNVMGAYQRLKASEQAWQKRWIESKQGPSPAPVGTQGQQAPDLDDEKTRRERMAQIIESRLAS